MIEKNSSGYLSVLAGVILFSAIEVISKSMAGNFPALPLVFHRFFIGGAVLLVYSFLFPAADARKLDTRRFLRVCVFAVIGVTLAMSLFHLSLKSIRASNGATIFCINPIFAAFFAVLVLREKITSGIIIGIVFGFCGAAVISFSGSTLNMSEITGSALMIAAAVCFAFYTTLSKKLNMELGTSRATGLIFIIGSLLLIPVIARQGNAKYLTSWNGCTVEILMLSLACTGLAYLLFLGGLTRVNVTRGISIFYLKPVMASILAMIFLDENLTLRLGAGILLVSLGLYFTLKKRKKADCEKP